MVNKKFYGNHVFSVLELVLFWTNATRHQIVSAIDFIDAVQVIFSPYKLLGRAWASPTLMKRRPPRSIYLCIFVHVYMHIYVCIVHHSINKCARILIHWTALILQCVIDSVNATTFKYLRLLQFCMCSGRTRPCMVLNDDARLMTQLALVTA